MPAGQDLEKLSLSSVTIFGEAVTGFYGMLMTKELFREAV